MVTLMQAGSDKTPSYPQKRLLTYNCSFLHKETKETAQTAWSFLRKSHKNLRTSLHPARGKCASTDPELQQEQKSERVSMSLHP